MTDDTPTTTAATTDTDAETTVSTPTLSAEQEINALRAAHQFFSNFDRVPGFLANQWSQALDTIAVVANSLIGKHAPTATSAEGTDDSATTDTTVTQ